MAQGKKLDIELRANIKADKISNPDLSTRDLAEQHWVWKSTVADIIDEIPEELRASSGKWEKIITTMDEIIDWIASITSLSIKTIQGKIKEWTLSVSDLKSLNDIAKNNFDRKQILTWKPTDITKHEWLERLSNEELLKIVNGNN